MSVYWKMQVKFKGQVNFEGGLTGREYGILEPNFKPGHDQTWAPASYSTVFKEVTRFNFKLYLVLLFVIMKIVIVYSICIFTISRFILSKFECRLMNKAWRSFSCNVGMKWLQSTNTYHKCLRNILYLSTCLGLN